MTTQPPVRPVSPEHSFDLEPLRLWMNQHVGPVSQLEVAQFEGGQSNPTFLLTTADHRFVLRRKPGGTLLPSAHAVDREFRIMKALAGSAVPVPKVHALCEDDSVIGTAFYVMDYIQGRILWEPGNLPMPRHEQQQVFEQMNQVIADLHSLDYQQLGLGDYGRSEGYVARQVVRWSKQYRGAETETIAAMDQLMAWLPEHLPGREATSLVHGDYRLDNLVFHPTEPRILAVLDWELSTLGDPLVDFAYHCLTWRMSSTEFRGLADYNLVEMGLPTEADYVQRYFERSGQTPCSQADWEFYVVFNLFRLASILQGVLSRALQGNASSLNALAAGRRARLLADMAWRQVERLEKTGGK